MQFDFPSWYHSRAFLRASDLGYYVGCAVPLRLITGVLWVIWLVLVLAGKGGFVHLLLLSGIGVAVVEIVTVYRTRLTN